MKTCSIEGCNNPVWSKGMCKMHIPKTPIRKSCPIPEKKTGLDKIIDDTFTHFQKRNDFFMTIWDKRPHICQHCGAHLGREPRSYMFDHILEKQKHKSLEFEEENIWMVCLSCHDQKSRGIITEKYREKINFVSTKFNVS